MIDTDHIVDRLFGVVNIPNGVWIDEEGTIVRPAEPAWPAMVAQRGPSRPDPDRPAPEREPAAQLPERTQRMLAAVRRSKIDRTRYAPAVRDWAANGPASRFVLTAEEVIERSNPGGADQALAAAHFELAQHLWQAGRKDPARRHFREAHRLYPDNWTYKRQAWSIEPSQLGGNMERYWQGPVDGAETEWPYEGDFLTDVEALGDRDYYPVPDDMRG